MKHKRAIIVSLLCSLLASTILIGALSLERMSRAYSYASQFAAAAAVSTSSTNLSLLLYGEPPTAQSLDLFQYVAAQTIEWRGTSVDQTGNPINVAFKLGSVKFEKLAENNYTGKATALDTHVSVSDLLDVSVKADKISVNVTFWTYLGIFPAFNITGQMTGNVEVGLSLAILPLIGLQQSLYEYKGDQFGVSMCIIRPMHVKIEKPTQNDIVRGDVPVQALIDIVPTLSIESVQCWVRNGENIPIQYNTTSNRWEGIWQSYNSGNGPADLHVRAQAVVWKSGQKTSYQSEDGINVEVDNPWVNSCVDRGGGQMEFFGGLKVRLDLDSGSWERQTTFFFNPWIGLNLTADEYSMNGNVRFNSWGIYDDQGNTLSNSFDRTLTITQDISNMLFNAGGRARELRCVYTPV